MNREDLKNYIETKKWVDQQLEDYNERIERVTSLSQSLDGLPKAKGKANYEIEKIIDEFKEILEIVHQEQQKLNEVIKQLNLMKNPLHRNILYLRYIKGLKLEQISTEVNYSYNRTCSFNGYALNEFDKLGKKC